MGWLILVLHIFIGSTLAGAAVIAALVTGNDGVAVIVGAAVLGYVLAVPLAWVVARKLAG